MSRTAWIVLGAVTLPLCGLAAGCDAADANADTLTIGAYSVVRDAFHEAVLPAFAAELEAHGPAARCGSRSRTAAREPRPGRSPRGFDADIAILSLRGRHRSNSSKAGLVRSRLE